MDLQTHTNEVKSLLPDVVKAQEKLNATDFDYGYYYNEDYWECIFFLRGKPLVTLRAETEEQLRLKLNDFHNL